MVKKTVRLNNPKWFCTQNILILFVGCIGVLVLYLYYIVFSKHVSPESINKSENIVRLSLDNIPSNVQKEPTDPRIQLSNPYHPPLKTDTILLSKKNDSTQVPPVYLVSNMNGTSSLQQEIVSRDKGIPVNVNTSVVDTPYTQMGILTKQNGDNKEPVILPLMGRNLLNGRDKWMYYTMTNSAGSINTRLPIRVNGKSGTNEYGCDMIYTGDTVHVDGYNDVFSATIYENAVLRYLPIV